MARGAAARNRDQYEPVEDRKRLHCSCFYAFLIFLTIVVLLAVAGGAGFAGWLVYTFRPEINNNEPFVYDVNINETDNVNTEAEVGSGGDVQYSKIVPYKTTKNVKIESDDATATPATQTTLGSASRVLAHSTGNQLQLIVPGEPVSNVSDADLLKLTERMWNAAQPRMIQEGKGYTLNLGHQLNDSTKGDLSPDKLITMKVDLKTKAHTYETFLRLFDNYIHVFRAQETHSDVDIKEIDEFLNDVITSPTMQLLQSFLVSKDLASSYRIDFRRQLWGMWFDIYSRSSRHKKMDSSGFEHVFLGETKKNKAYGLRNWLQLWQQEEKNKANYYGYYTKVEPGMISIRLRWNKKLLHQTSFFVGTPPEYDLAVYTLCAITRNNGSCPVNVGGQRISVHTTEVEHIEGIQILDAYIAIKNIGS